MHPKTLVFLILFVSQIVGASQCLAAGDHYIEPGAACGSKYPCSDSIQNTLNAAEDRSVLHTASGAYVENVTFDRPGIRLVLDGGWDAAFQVIPPSVC